MVDPEQEPRRPRVVDKRVSARPPGAEPPPPAQAGPPSTQQSEPAAPAAEPAAMPEAAPPEGHLWTPEQEAEIRRVAEEIRATPSSDWVLNTAVTLANVAATKLDAGMMSDAQLAIDALAGVVNAVGGRLGDSEAALRQMLAQLQLAFAQQTPAGPDLQ